MNKQLFQQYTPRRRYGCKWGSKYSDILKILDMIDEMCGIRTS